MSELHKEGYTAFQVIEKDGVRLYHKVAEGERPLTEEELSARFDKLKAEGK